MDDLNELPAQPCLASRIETGIGVDARTLTFIDTVERALSALLPRQAALRCGITARGVVVECDPLPMGNARVEAERLAAALCIAADRSFVDVCAYRRGSAFLVPQGAA